ncbi:hypothetical protein ACJX0J_018076, partial [Zea mays]
STLGSVSAHAGAQTAFFYPLENIQHINVFLKLQEVPVRILINCKDAHVVYIVFYKGKTPSNTDQMGDFLPGLRLLQYLKEKGEGKT